MLPTVLEDETAPASGCLIVRAPLTVLALLTVTDSPALDVSVAETALADAT
jgi:hypothetical protein